MTLDEDLYREVILDHFKNPRNKGVLENYDIKASGANPFCGDEIEITLKMNSAGIETMRIQTHGCAISQSSASMMAELLEGKKLAEARQWIEFFKNKLLRDNADPWPEAMEDLQALEGVKKYPVRVKCAVLSWNTLIEGLEEFKAKGSKEKTMTTHSEG